MKKTARYSSISLLFFETIELNPELCKINFSPIYFWHMNRGYQNLAKNCNMEFCTWGWVELRLMPNLFFFRERKSFALRLLWHFKYQQGKYFVKQRHRIKNLICHEGMSITFWIKWLCFISTLMILKITHIMKILNNTTLT